METLWAPWRMEYIAGPPMTGCIFCESPKAGDDRTLLILARREHAFAMLNRFPYNNGHVLLSPYRHVPELGQLERHERLAILDLATETIEALKETMRPHGFNLGVNMGRVAGAGVAEHVHLHVVPRWDGDTSFMPVTGLAKVVSQHLLDTFDALAPKLAGRTP
jgi:ATP adenylyltransferase